MVLPWAGQGMSIGWGSGLSTPIQAFAELGRATGTGSSTTLTVSSFANKKWLLCLLYMKCAANANVTMQFNSDTGSNYANRVTQDGSADTTTVSQTTIKCDGGQTVVAATGAYAAIWIENSSSSNEKLVIGHTSHGDLAGAANAPDRTEYVSKWSNTSNAITTITITSTSNFSTDSELIVLGADPADTNVTPFFKELGRTSWSSGGTISVSSFTAKKYLLSTLESTLNGSANHVGIQFNSDTGSNYSDRFSLNGGADSTQTSVTTNYFTASDHPSQSMFSTAWIINTSANEKLSIVHGVYGGTSGAGNAPNRDEIVGKWANTSNQISTISAKTDAGAFTEGELVVYGEN